MLTLLMSVSVAAPSALWGETGELWSPQSRLPDFSYAGYRAGDEPIPELPVLANIMDFGAAADGQTDDTEALRAAIAQAQGGAVYLPEGRYLISDVIRVDQGPLVLRGDGPDRTTLFFPNSLTDLRGEAPQWSWNGGMIWIQPTESQQPLSAVTQGAARGDSQLLLADASGVQPGDLVELQLTDDDERTLGWHLHNDQEEPGDCTWQTRIELRWPVRVAAVSGDQITLDQPLRVDVRPEWSPTLNTRPAVAQVGVEQLRMAFPDVPYAGHLDEPGYNGVFMVDGVVDSWLDQVTFENADNGLLTDRGTKNVTARGVRFVGRDGHHGFNAAFTADSLFTELDYEQDFVHAMTVDHRSSGNVFSRVRATEASGPVEMDHHRDSSFENLFTAFEAEANLINGGSWCAGVPGGARNTFWGLPPLYEPYWSNVQTNLVGQILNTDGVLAEEQLSEQVAWVEQLEELTPRNLHLAQLAARHGELYQDTGLAEDSDPPEDTEPEGCGCSQSAPTAPGAAALVFAMLLLRRREVSWSRPGPISRGRRAAQGP